MPHQNSTLPKSVLFVCLGNICRSPAAESVMAQKCQKAKLAITFDSAGTANYHIGEAPDRRTIAIGKRLGYDLSKLRARQVGVQDFYRFEQIFAMDKQNLANLQTLHAQAIAHANGQAVAKLTLFDPHGKAVADPYYGDDDDFLAMFAHLQNIADDYLATWQNQHQRNF